MSAKSLRRFFRQPKGKDVSSSLKPHTLLRPKILKINKAGPRAHGQQTKLLVRAAGRRVGRGVGKRELQLNARVFDVPVLDAPVSTRRGAPSGPGKRRWNGGLSARAERIFVGATPTAERSDTSRTMRITVRSGPLNPGSFLALFFGKSQRVNQKTNFSCFVHFCLYGAKIHLFFSSGSNLVEMKALLQEKR